MIGLICDCGAQADFERVTEAYTVYWCPICNKKIAVTHINENGNNHDREP